MTEENAVNEPIVNSPTFNEALEQAVENVNNTGSYESRAEEEPQETTETSAEEPTQEEGSDEALKMTWERVEARDRAMQQERAEMRAMKKKMQEYEERLKGISEADKLKNEDPVKWLRSQGLTEDQIVDRILNDGKPGQADLKNDVEQKYQQQQKELERLREELMTQRQEGFVKEIYSKIYSDEKYKWLAEYENDNPLLNLGQIAFNVAQNEHQSTGVNLTTSQILDTIDLGLENIRKRYVSVSGPEEAKPAQNAVNKPDGRPGNSQTITNRDSADSSPLPSDYSNMSWEQKIAFAAKEV